MGNLCRVNISDNQPLSTESYALEAEDDYVEVNLLLLLLLLFYFVCLFVCFYDDDDDDDIIIIIS